jgi:hypothetical protein
MIRARKGAASRPTRLKKRENIKEEFGRRKIRKKVVICKPQQVKTVIKSTGSEQKGDYFT